MNCKECEKKISNFIANALEEDEAEAFIKHIESCPECKEELSIQYLVNEGIARLEDGRTFNLAGELDYKIAREKNHIEFFHNKNRAFLIMEFLLIIVVSYFSLFVLYDLF